MKKILNLIKYDYLQRTRSYQFLIILAASLAFSYTLIPTPDANYSTVRVGDYLGHYNSPWIAYVTALMASVFVSMVGYYLINNSIKIDQSTKVGQIVAATRISNFHYLIAKFLGNFLVLLTIVILIFFVSIALFFLYSTGYPFEIHHFLVAYLLIPIPTIAFIAALAVVLEVMFKNKSVLQNTVFFILFMALLAQDGLQGTQGGPLGVDYPSKAMEKQVGKDKLSKSSLQKLNIGFIIGDKKLTKRFEFKGVSISPSYVLFRLFWPLLGVLFLYISSKYFHRFEHHERLSLKKEKKKRDQQLTYSDAGMQEMDISSFPKLDQSMSLWPVFKTELLMMIRKGKRWLWLLNLSGVIVLAVIPLKPAHLIALPILWFLQVHRWADLVTKEKHHQMHFFIFSSFKPVQRLLTSQFLAGTALALTLAFPLIIRYALLGQLFSVVSIIVGAICVIAFSAFAGIVTRGKRFFEIIFFFITYLNINGFPYTNYYGGVDQSMPYLMLLVGITVAFSLFSFLLRNMELRKV